MKYTPGPWQYKDGGYGKYYVKSGDTVIADCAHIDCDPSYERTEYNARLIAAAPELLEALQMLCQHSDNWKPDVWNNARAATANATRAL